MLVEVRNNDVNRALKVLKRKLAAEGFFKEIQKRRFYEKPSDRKRRVKRAAESKLRKQLNNA